uniref:ARAD1D02002p n=1 Tax=Blastobotrys adeninivorans TaxID=409370 RepID=A0A060T8A1_BLAAD
MSLVKRPRTAESSALTTAPSSATAQSEVVQLHGHEDAVLAVEFSSTGTRIASCSADKSICLWSASDHSNYGLLKGHKGAVLDVKWTRDENSIISASSDLTVATWDAYTGQRIRKHLGHEDMVNCLDVVRRGPQIFVSGSDDGTIGIWDPRQKEAVSYFETEYPVLAVAVDSMGSTVYSSGVDPKIHAWDSRNTSSPLYSLTGHGDGLVTSIKVSPDDQQLASNGTDNTVRTWDIRSFTTNESRKLKILDGSIAGVEQSLLRLAWSSDGKRLAAGSSDRTAVIWDVFTRNIIHKLPGHLGSVNDVAFSPTDDNVFVSASSDRSLILGPLR